jgi:hypothetical protein
MIILKFHFLATASHDLRQPLQTIKLLSAAMSRLAGSSEIAGLLKHQEQAIEGTTRLLNALLDISRLESGAIEPQCTNVVIAELLEELRAEFETIARARGLDPITVALSTLSASESSPRICSIYVWFGERYVAAATAQSESTAADRCSDSSQRTTASVVDPLAHKNRLFGAAVSLHMGRVGMRTDTALACSSNDISMNSTREPISKAHSGGVISSCLKGKMRPSSASIKPNRLWLSSAEIVPEFIVTHTPLEVGQIIRAQGG